MINWPANLVSVAKYWDMKLVEPSLTLSIIKYQIANVKYWDMKLSKVEPSLTLSNDLKRACELLERCVIIIYEPHHTSIISSTYNHHIPHHTIILSSPYNHHVISSTQWNKYKYNCKQKYKYKRELFFKGYSVANTNTNTSTNTNTKVIFTVKAAAKQILRRSSRHQACCAS